MRKIYKFKAEVLLYPGTSGWHFAYLPRGEAKLIRESFRLVHRGWGSLPVGVRLGGSTWQTSIFFDKRSETYLLPLKAAVRKAEGVLAGQKVGFSLHVLV